MSSTAVDDDTFSVSSSTSINDSASDPHSMQKAFPNQVVIAIWLIMGIIWIFGFLANVFALVLISRMKRTPLNTFIMGLCLSDILSAVASPLYVRALLTVPAHFPWNQLICKTLYPTTTVASSITISIVLVLSIWRLYAILRPHKASNIMTLRKAKLIVSLIWLITIITLVPFAAWNLELQASSQTGLKVCAFKSSASLQKDIFMLVDIVGLNLVPISAIVVLSVTLGLAIFKRIKKRSAVGASGQGFRKDEKKALIQVGLVVASFLVGYLPKFGSHITCMYTPISIRVLTIVTLAYRAVLNLTESINPVLYILGSSTIYKAARQSIISVFSLWRSSPRNGPPLEQQTHEIQKKQNSSSV